MELLPLVLMLGVAGGIGLIYQLSKLKGEAKAKRVERYEENNFYTKRKRFFTRSEYMFFQELEKQNNGKYHIFSKVRLEDIVQVRSELDYRTKRIKRNSIKSRHIDFVLVDKVSGAVVKAVELDGKSHNSEKQNKSDEIKNKILKASSIDFVHVRVGESFEGVIKTMYI